MQLTQEEKIRAHVEACIDRYKEQCGVGFTLLALEPTSREHIVNIGTSILCTKWQVGVPGGSFVRAVVDNDLMGAFGRADSINQQAIQFYVMLLHNSSYIK